MEEFGISNSNYSKIENGVREITVKELQKLSRLFDMTLDQIVNFDRDIPEEVTLKDKSNMEPLNLINQLDDEDRKPSLRSLIPCSPKRSLKTFSRKM